MLKNISNLGTILNKEDQKSINGGLSPFQPISCNSPYFTPDGTCDSGDFNHPTLGHCVCCQG